jgi:predicted aspartyl protease
VKVPMIQWDGVRPGVHVLVNGKGPYLFLIDTGAGGVARADTRLINALRLSPSGTAPRNDGSATARAAQSTMPEYTLDTITLGDITRRSVRTPSRSYNSNPKPGIDGILGYGFFAGCLLTLDYATKEVRVSPGNLMPGRDTLRYGSDDGGPEIPIRIGQVKATANLDTGDNEGITLPARISNKLRFRGPPRAVGTAHSANNTYEIREAPLAGKIRIGKLEWTDPLVSFSDVFENVNVGSRILQHSTITFDQTTKRIRLTRGK